MTLWWVGFNDCVLLFLARLFIVDELCHSRINTDVLICLAVKRVGRVNMAGSTCSCDGLGWVMTMPISDII